MKASLLRSISASIALIGISMMPTGPVRANATTINAGQQATINAHSACRVVGNNGSSRIMVPHRTAQEWVTGGSSFLQGVPPSVTVSACPPETTQWRKCHEDNRFLWSSGSHSGGCADEVAPQSNVRIGIARNTTGWGASFSYSIQGASVTAQLCIDMFGPELFVSASSGQCNYSGTSIPGTGWWNNSNYQTHQQKFENLYRNATGICPSLSNGTTVYVWRSALNGITGGETNDQWWRNGEAHQYTCR